MKAYWFNEESYAQHPDQRLPHTYSPERPVSEGELKTLGLLHWTIPTDNWEPKIDEVAAERGYKNRDRLNVTKEGLGDQYEAKLKMFFDEHLHEDEEIRYIFEGSGYFDIRDLNTDKWIRLRVEPNDLIVLPAGIYHRFTLDDKNAIKVLRLFKDSPKWLAINRSTDADANPYRQDYIREIIGNA